MEKKSTKRQDDERDFLGTVKDSSSQIWLAGLGAFAKAQQEGGKVFEALMKEGSGMQTRLRQFTNERVGADVAGRFSEVTQKATVAWDKLESVFEERVGRAVGRLGMPSKAEVEALRAEVAALRKIVTRMSATPASPKLRPRKVASSTPRTKRVAKSTQSL